MCVRPAGLQLNSATVKAPRAVEQSAVECALSAKQAAPCGDSLGVDQKPGVQGKSQPGKFDICSKQEQSLLKNLSTDSISVAPIKRCKKCLSCVQCKRHYLPDMERQLQQVQIIKDRLSFKDGRVISVQRTNN